MWIIFGGFIFLIIKLIIIIIGKSTICDVPTLDAPWRRMLANIR